MAKYLVSGGCGFIGSHLVERLLADGHDVVVLDDLSNGSRDCIPAKATLFVGDVRDVSALEALSRDVDGCFHLAAVASVEQSRLNWHETHQINQGGTVAVLEAVRRQPHPERIPVVYASSAAAYGDNPEIPLVETASPCPISAYGIDKLGGEMHARAAASAYGIRSVGFRIFNAYGPRQDARSPYSGVISIFAKLILDGKPITIFGDGEQTRDFVFVEDVVDHLLAAMDNSPQGAEVFNVSSGQATKVNKLAELLGKIAGRKVSIVRSEPRSGDIRHSCGSVGRAVARFGLTKRTGLEAGLRTTVEWMRETGERKKRAG